MSPHVNVVIPVYNRPVAVRRAISSVLAQTCQNFEVIVVDDGSTDTTASEVAAIGDPRIRLIRHGRRHGGSAARNSGVAAGTAPYVAFLDSDDEWVPTKLERQLAVFRGRADDLGLVYCGAERILPDGSVLREMPRRYDDLVRRLLLDNVVGGASVGMVPRRVLDRIGGFDPDLRSGQDVDLWLRICEHFAADFVPAPLVRIWQTGDSERITANVASLISGRSVFLEKHRQKLLRHGVLHLWLRHIGWIHHRYAGDRRAARSLYRRSIRTQPAAPLSYVLWLAAFLPLSWLDHLARYKRQLTGLAGRNRTMLFRRA